MSALFDSPDPPQIAEPPDGRAPQADPTALAAMRRARQRRRDAASLRIDPAVNPQGSGTGVSIPTAPLL